MKIAVLALLIAVSCTLSWVPWPYKVLSSPKTVQVVNFYFSSETMKKNSTISLRIEILVVGDHFVWFGPKSITLETGRVLNGHWQASTNREYQQNETIYAEFTCNTGNHTETYVASFTDSTSQIQVQFKLPYYQLPLEGNRERESNMLGASPFEPDSHFLITEN